MHLITKLFLTKNFLTKKCFPTILHLWNFFPGQIQRIFSQNVFLKIFKELPYSYLQWNWHDMIPCGAYQDCTHVAAQQFLYCSIILPPRELLVKVFKEVPYSYLKWNWHDLVPCGAYQYCTHLSTQEFSIALLLSNLKNQTIVSSCVTHILPSCSYFKGQEQICFNPTSWHLVTCNFLRGHKFWLIIRSMTMPTFLA